MIKPPKIYPSSSGFAWGTLVFTDSKAGCLRAIYISSKGVKEEIPEYHKIRGLANEELHEALLKKLGIPYSREVVIKDMVDGVESSGRADFILHHENGDQIDELKSTESKNVSRDVIKNGHVKPEHLAQLVNYMTSLKITESKLITTYLEKDKDGKYEAKSDRVFQILIDESGRICVDGTPTKFHVSDQIRHRQLSAKVVKDEFQGKIPRPNNGTTPFVGSCGFCPYKLACDKYDDGSIEGNSALVDMAKQLIAKGETSNE